MPGECARSGRGAALVPVLFFARYRSPAVARRGGQCVRVRPARKTDDNRRHFTCVPACVCVCVCENNTRAT